MRRPRSLPSLLAVSLTAALMLAGVPAGAQSPASDPTGLPAGVPEAALRVEPVLPAPPGWPFGQQFSRTSGTGRTAGGASFWTDFVYDDHGATDPLAFPTTLLTGTSALAPTQGVYRYPPGPASGNGADVFRTAVGLTDDATWWRVDWTTLVDPAVPLAVWGIDLDGDAATGGGAWPASAGVGSPGEDRYLVVSAAGARLLDTAGSVLAELPTLVDLPSRSFVTRVPRTVLPVAGSSGLRLVAGLADAAGTGLAVPTTGLGTPPAGTARVYNASFRAVEDEPPVYGEGGSVAGRLATALGAVLAGDLTGIGLPDVPLLRAQLLDQVGLDGLTRVVTGNFWMEDHQAEALAAGDVTPFTQPVDWTALAARAQTPEPRPSGYSNRWYVSAIEPAQGVVNDAMPPGDLAPNYLSRIQPYAVHVPEGVQPGAPLTWVLHSLGVNHNQYGALNPETLRQLCDDRGSVCATTLGRGPDLWYFDESEVDFWDVWREVAQTYRTSTERTVLGGYSMGGYAAYKLGLAHADLFAGAIVLAGPPSCGIQLAEGLLVPADISDPSSRCAADGPTGPLVGNALHLPYVISHGAADQVVPVTSVLERVQQLSSAGLRHEFALYPAEDHLAYATQDRFARQVAGLAGTPARTVDPARVQHSWYPHLDDAGLGVGTTTAYWLSGFRAASSAPGAVAAVAARSLALADPAVTTHSVGPELLTTPSPGVLTGLTWELGAVPPTEPVLELALTGATAVTVDAARAAVGCGTAVRAASDVPAVLTMAGLPAGARLDGPGADGSTASLPAGDSALTVVCPSSAAGGVAVAGPGAAAGPDAAAGPGAAARPAAAAGLGPVRAVAQPRLPATGAAPLAALAGVLLLGAAAVLRRRGGAG